MLAAYRALGARGRAALSVRLAAEKLQVPKSTLHRNVECWPRKPRRLSRETRRKLDELILDDVPERDIVERLGVSKGTIWRRKRHLRESDAGIASCEEWRCPQCGKLWIVVRCPIDGAESPRDKGAGGKR
jgi:rubrerythrin